MSTLDQKSAGIGTYFTQNGHVWSVDSAESIAHAVIEYPNGTVIEGAHNGRIFNGQCEEFQPNGILRDIWMNDQDGKVDVPATLELIHKASFNENTVTLANSLSVSPAATHHLKAIAANRL